MVRKVICLSEYDEKEHWEYTSSSHQEPQMETVAVCAGKGLSSREKRQVLPVCGACAIKCSIILLLLPPCPGPPVLSPSLS